MKLSQLYVSFLGGTVNKESTCQAGDTTDAGLIPGSRTSPGVVNGTLLQYYYLGNPMERGAWWATAHGVQRVRHS